MTGQTISHYRVLDELGAGGMGVVYRAEDLKLARPVALKFLTAERIGDRNAVERFLREARTTSGLNHPNICTIYEVDEDSGMQFIAMELLQGRTLDRYIDGRPLPIGRLLDLAAQIADALEAAHAQNVLHRDIKPANIFVTDRGQAKILDFGLAKLTGPKRHDQSLDTMDATHMQEAVLTTKQGVAMGTVAYMSPEQARGEDLDARSDLFSLGVVLYEMATGERSFQGTTSAIVFDGILNREPRAPIELNANIPLDLERVIGRLLEKKRELRYQTAVEVLADLRRIRQAWGPADASSASRSTVTSSNAASNWPSASGMTPAAKPAPKAARIPQWAVLAAGAVGLVAVTAIGFALLGGDDPATTSPETAAPVSAVAEAAPPPAPAPPVPATPEAASVAAVATPTDAKPAARPAASPAAAPAPAAPPLPPASKTAKPAAPPAGAAPKPASSPTDVAPASATPASAAPASAAPVSAAPPTNAANANTDALKAARAKADAKLWDQALADVKAILARNPPANVASSALLLMGTIHVGQERPDEAMAAYIELRSRYGNSPVVAEATYHLADLLLRSKRTDRDTAAIEMFGEVVNNHANSPWAPRALVRRAAVEERTRARVTDQQVGAMVPAALISYRTLVEKYPGSDGEENALDKLAEMYDNLRRYDLAGQMLMTLATKFPANKRDAAWRAGELYERRLKDSEKARAAYALVPAQSSRYRDAQKKLSEKN